MPEYIEREELLKDINETVVFTVRNGVKLPTSEMRGANKVIDRIKSAPTADVDEVVRCEDCKFLQYGECRVLGIKAGGCFYCYLGERKKE
ncbi:MAG: hypothetical protein U0K91_02225 [Acutalibacteraceae bacterium]|nr:hypothetical protein [Acutalibacteraceae bacterium]